MKRLLILFALSNLPAILFAHEVHHNVLPGGIAVQVFYSEQDPASYSEYEVFGPEDNAPYSLGRTDKNGVVCFLPDRKGKWRIKVIGESMHGYHGQEVFVEVDQNLDMKSFSKPLIAKYHKWISGLGLIFGIFGVIALFQLRTRSK